MKLELNFFRFLVIVMTEDNDVFFQLKRIYSYFLTDGTIPIQSRLTLELSIRASALDLIPEDLVSTLQTDETNWFDKNDIWYCQYLGMGVVKFNTLHQHCQIAALNLDSLIFLTKELITSRLQKFCFGKKNFRLSAVAVSNERINVVALSDLDREKKSFLNSIKDVKELKLISPTGPFLNQKGSLLTFPISNSEKDHFAMEVCNETFLKNTMILILKRNSSTQSSIISVGKLSVLHHLIFSHFGDASKGHVHKKSWAMFMDTFYFIVSIFQLVMRSQTYLFIQGNDSLLTKEKFNEILDY